MWRFWRVGRCGLSRLSTASAKFPRLLACSSRTLAALQDNWTDHRPQGFDPNPYAHTGPPAQSAAPKKGPSTFVSSHYQVSRVDVQRYLDRKQLTCRDSGNETVVRDCPFCHPTHNKLDNLWKLYISDSGAYFCHRCNAQGSWFDFKRSLGDLNLTIQATELGKPQVASFGPQKTARLPKAGKTLTAKDIQTLLQPLSSQRKLTEMLTGTDTTKGQRGIAPAVLELYGVGATNLRFPDEKTGQWREHLCVAFPWTETTGQGRKRVTRLKARSLEAKGLQRLLPAGGEWGLFGWHTVPSTADSVVITEGEYDAMAVFQATGIPAISLPNGARSLPVDLLPRLERFKRIFLWMDNDRAGIEGAEMFAKKLGQRRTLIVQPLPGEKNCPKDANEALLRALQLPKGPQRDKAMTQMKERVLSAKPLPHKEITTFAEYRQEVYNEFADPQGTSGIQLMSFPGLNKLLKGHRKGEVTIMTGPTGIGKTSFLSQFSLDLADQAVSTLWGSFELKNPRLMKKMLMQFAKDVDLTSQLDAFPYWADRFEQLPLYFLRFFGSTNVHQVSDAMEFAHYAYDVEHVVLDNLQFMLAGQHETTQDKFDVQDRALDVIRQFASRHNVHITLVIHPRKEQGDFLNVQSVFGHAKATQEADNVVIMQRGPSPDYRLIEVKKNRFDGDVGTVPLKFTKVNSRLQEVEASELEALFQLQLNDVAQAQPTGRFQPRAQQKSQVFGQGLNPMVAGTAAEVNYTTGKGAPSVPVEKDWTENDSSSSLAGEEEENEEAEDNSDRESESASVSVSGEGVAHHDRDSGSGGERHTGYVRKNRAVPLHVQEILVE